MSTTAITTAPLDLPKLRKLSLVVGGVGLALCLLGAVFYPEQFFRSYLWPSATGWGWALAVWPC